MHKSAKEKISDRIRALILQKANVGAMASVEAALPICHLLVPSASLTSRQGR